MSESSRLILTTPAGEEIRIPPRLTADIDKRIPHDFDPSMKLSLKEAEDFSTRARQAQPTPGIEYALKATWKFRELQHLEQAILSLGTYVDKRVSLLLKSHEEQQAIALLTDSLVLAHTALPHARPEWVRDLTQQLVVATETVLSFFAPPLTDVDLFAVATDVITVLNVAQVIWEPVLKPLIESTAQCLSELSSDTDGIKQLDLQDMLNRLFAIQADIAMRTGHRAQAQSRLSLLKHLVDAIVEIVRKELIQSSSLVQSPNVSNLDLDREVQELIKQVERHLRTLIAEKYEKQFGASWIKHIASKHRQMYSSWTHNMQKDLAAFQSYQQYDPQILEYARFQDLTELINAQWHLFRESLDFGAAKRNKSIFSDKMKQIAQVRNPLAHHRSIPENELWRAKVLCTDILMCLAQSDQT